jgi:hypothetical protein
LKKTIKHLLLPDVQSKPGVPLDHLTHIGEYIVDKKPDVIINIGDFADMESLSSYDKGKRSFEGRRYSADIAVARKAMDMLLAPLKAYNKQKKKNKEKQYKPRMVLTLGNHEQRIARACDDNPELEGILGYHQLPYEDWEVHDFLKPVVIDGILYVHYLANPMSGKPYGGGALNQLKTVGQSFVVGHKQTLDVATRFTVGGQQQWGIICGACYQHDESYKGYQGNDHFRGVVMLHDVHNGSFSPCVVPLDYLRNKYGS